MIENGPTTPLPNPFIWSNDMYQYQEIERLDDVECINGCNQQHVYVVEYVGKGDRSSINFIYCMVPCKYEWYKRWKWKKRICKCECYNQ